MNSLLKTITVLSLCASASAFSTPATVRTTSTLSMADAAPDAGMKINTLIDLDAEKVVNMEVSFLFK
jgi:hypothetical protein